MTGFHLARPYYKELSTNKRLTIYFHILFFAKFIIKKSEENTSCMSEDTTRTEINILTKYPGLKGEVRYCKNLVWFRKVIK